LSSTYIFLRLGQCDTQPALQESAHSVAQRPPAAVHAVQHQRIDAYTAPLRTRSQMPNSPHSAKIQTPKCAPPSSASRPASVFFTHQHARCTHSAPAPPPTCRSVALDLLRVRGDGSPMPRVLLEPVWQQRSREWHGRMRRRQCCQYWGTMNTGMGLAESKAALRGARTAVHGSIVGRRTAGAGLR
jgi:hypothetical protein